MTKPPGTMRVLRLLSGLAVRRALNRWSVAFTRRKKDAAKRAPTPGKRRRNLALLGLLAIPYLFLIGQLTGQLIGRFSDALEGDDVAAAGKIAVREDVFDTLKEKDAARAKALDDLRETTDFATEAAAEHSLKWLRDDVRGRLEWEWRHQTRLSGGDPDDNVARDSAVRRWTEVYDAQGSKGFTVKPLRMPFVGALWSPAHSRELAGAMGAVMAMVFVCLVFHAFGGRDEPLGQVGWSLEWLFTMPVGAPTLFFGRLVEYALTDLFAWLLLPPFLMVTFVSAGVHWGWAIPLALASALFVSLLVASARLVGDTWLRKAFRPAFLRNVQAVLSVAYLLTFFGVLFLAYRVTLPGWITALLPHLGPATWLPCSWPMLLCLGGWAIPAAGAMLALGILAPLGAVKFAGHLVRGGLVNTSAAYEGRRIKGTGPFSYSAPTTAKRVAKKGTGPFFRGIVGKELRLLARDRTFLVQTLAVPIFAIGLQFVINDSLMKQLTSGSSHVATIAFGIGAYVLLFGAFNSLVSEGPALWLLYTFPEPIERIVRRKAILWGVISSLYPLTLIAAVLAHRGGASAATLANMALAIVGVFIYAYVAAGLGVLGVNPLETEPRRRIRPEMAQAYMLLAALYAYALYAPSAWAKIGTVTLCVLMAYAIWQKVRDHAPFLLDPTQLPPPRIALADGLIAALVFFVLQGVFTLIAIGNDWMSRDAAVATGYAAAGLLVTTGSLYVFWRRKVPGLLRAVGLRAAPAEKGTGPFSTSAESPLLAEKPAAKKGTGPFMRAAAVGLAWGFGAGAVGLAYLWALGHVEPLRAMRDEYMKSAQQLDFTRAWLVALAVLAAPLFEEFIFRGLVFRGLRRSLPFALAALASAGIFAVVHPAISVVPVFALGFAAAASFERTGLLLSPILAHMAYNFVVIVVQPSL